MGNEEIEEDLDPNPVTQASTLAGMSHGVETQILKDMFDSLPPSSQIIESEMLGLSASRARTEEESHPIPQTLKLRDRIYLARGQSNRPPRISR